MVVAGVKVGFRKMLWAEHVGRQRCEENVSVVVCVFRCVVFKEA